MSEAVPDGWNIEKLEDCCEVLDSLRIPINSEERATREGIYPYYGANGVQGYIDDFIFEGEAVLLAEDGGYFSEYATRPIANYVTGRFWVNNHAHILRSKTDTPTKWIYYSLVHKNILKHINGGTRAKLNQSDLKEIEILIAPLPEQKKIATILSSVDEVIEKTTSQINKLQDLKKATMNELLTRGIGHIQFKDSPAGRIPVEWDVQILTDVAKVIDCKHRTPRYRAEGFPVVRPRDVKLSGIDFNKCVMVDEVDFNDLNENHTPIIGDTVYSRNATFGIGVFIDQPVKFAIGQDVCVISPKKMVPVFFNFYLNSEIVFSQVLREMSGSTFKRINLGSIKKFQIAVPSLPEQQKIASILSSIDKNIKEKQLKLVQTQSLKKSLMQDLLTGKVRVKVH